MRWVGWLLISAERWCANMTEDQKKRLQDISDSETENEDVKFTEDERFIMDVLNYVGASKDNFLGVMTLLNDDEEQSATYTAKLAKYLKYKGKYVTEQDILKKLTQIMHKREQYYPRDMYVRYLGETTEKLTNNEIYQVGMVFGCDEFFLIQCDDNTCEEFSAELFEMQEIEMVEYVGFEHDNGEITITDGFELNKTYEIERLNMGKYEFTNGLKCWFYEVEPVTVRKASIYIPQPFENIDEALRLLRDAIEYGKLKTLSPYLHPDCEYISQPANRKLNTKLAFIKCWREVAENQLARDIFSDCDFGTLIEVPEDSKFPVGTRCVIDFGDKNPDIFLVRLNEEGNFITGIYVYDRDYLYDNHYKLKADYEETEKKSEDDC